MSLSVVQNNKGPAEGASADPVPSPADLLVLKFGSSVLQTIEDLPAVAGEIYRQRRRGNRIVAVVSALAGETDFLFAQASEVAAGIDCDGTADLVSLGEERTAALLRIACDRIGLETAICRAEELGLHTTGAELDAAFGELLPFALLRKLEQTGVVIVPGFVGLAEHGSRTLLGRGGSDFTAAIIGGELGARTVRLYKDVDGVFECDPALDPSARKFEEVGYADALRVGAKLVHSKAIEFAEGKNLPIEVEGVGSTSPTRIGGQCRIAATAGSKTPVRIALAGYGIVGQALAKRIAKDDGFTIASILVRDLKRPREIGPQIPLTDDLHLFAKAEADIMIELLSCARTGAALCSRRLRNGISVATASKRVVSDHFEELLTSAQAGGARLLYSAAVGGSAPFLETIDRAKAQTEIVKVEGILNGTVNFVLQRLASGTSLNVALDVARERGFAEEDCEADLSGTDAAAKLRIIAYHAFGISPRDLHVDIQRLDEDLAAMIQVSGQRWVQLSEVSRQGSGVVARVRFCLDSEAGVRVAPDEWNVGTVRLKGGREIGLRGRGAGGAATAEAVLADLYELIGENSPQTMGARQAVGSLAVSSQILASASPGVA